MVLVPLIEGCLRVVEGATLCVTTVIYQERSATQVVQNSPVGCWEDPEKQYRGILNAAVLDNDTIPVFINRLHRKSQLLSFSCVRRTVQHL